MVIITFGAPVKHITSEQIRGYSFMFLVPRQNIQLGKMVSKKKQCCLVFQLFLLQKNRAQFLFQLYFSFFYR